MAKQAPGAPVTDVLSPAELRAAIEQLSPADLFRLEKVARGFGALAGKDPEDLLQEAIMRALADVRHCPRDVSVPSFLMGAMKSLVSADRKSAPANRVIAPVDDPAVEGEIAKTHATEATPEEAIVDRLSNEDVVESVFELFHGDDDATYWLMARMDTDTLAEAQAATGFDSKKMNTVGKRVRRKIERELAPRLKP
ncbi:MAG TPA: hypothetical protein VMV19_18775 [Xanthobacteraceae bacterium]|nr:hypothetical protein [Xanthobacteraceae bacterium]